MTKLSGKHALYGLTPFKLRETNPYKMVVAPVSYLHPDNESLWTNYRSSSYVEKFSVPAPGFDKEVIQPYQLFGREFASDSDEGFVFEHKNIGDPSSWTYPPMYMEISYEALENTGYCTEGWVVSASENKCPVRHKCPNQENPESEGGCKHYRQNGKYSRLYSVNPDIETHFADPALSEFERFTSIRYRDKPLLSLGYTEEAEFQAYINRIVFSSKVPWIHRTPSLFTHEGLGFRMQNVNAVEAEFSPDTLREFTLECLEGSERLKNWVALKYVCYDADDGGRISEKNGFDAIDKLEGALDEAINAIEEDSDNGSQSLVDQVKDVNFREDEDAAGFAEVLLMHSFAHLLRDRICIEYGADSDQISYYLEHPRIESDTVQSGKVRIVLHESAIGGFGYLEEFRDSYIRGDMTLDDYLEPISRFLDEHGEEARDSYGEVFQFLERFDDPIREDAEAALKSLDDLGLYPPFRSVRKVLDDRHDLASAGESKRSQFQRLGEKAPQCWDGCGICVEDDDDCSYLPFDRSFLLSRSLAKEGVDVLIEGASNATTMEISRTLYHTIDAFLKSARSEIFIATEYLSYEIVEAIVESTKDWDVEVRIILDESMGDGTDASPFGDMEIPQVQYRYGEVDKTRISMDGVATVSGDFQLKERELMSSQTGESVEISFDPVDTGEQHAELERQWANLS